VDPSALVLAASQHNTKACAIIGIDPQKMPFVGYFLLSPYDFLSSASLIRNGFECRFRSDNDWEPNVTKTWANVFEETYVYPWDNPMHFIARASISVLGGNASSSPKEIDVKITPAMMTTMGFTSFQFGNKLVQELETPPVKSESKKYYVGISGGGWRALAGHMGAFRALSNHMVLPKVSMFSSVSGGTWFLTKLSFDDNFSRKVLRNETHIGEDVLEWMEQEYFVVIRNTTHFPQTKENQNQVSSFLTSLVTQAPAPVRAAMSSGIIAANHFGFSWQPLVEQAVLGAGIVSSEPLANTNLASESRSNFGKATLAFNWNHLHQWESPSTCSKWFLKGKQGDHVQYPVYTSALYQELSEDDIRFQVVMQGKDMDNLFNVCYKENEDFCDNDASLNSDAPGTQHCGEFRFRNLTVGQVASASSAAVGGGAVRAWVQNAIELVRRKAKDALKGSVNVWYCKIYVMLIENLLGSCNHKLVLEEFSKFIGCASDSIEKEDSEITAKRWVGFLEKMAIKITVDSPLANGTTHQGHMAIDAVIKVQRAFKTPCTHTHTHTHTYTHTCIHTHIHARTDPHLHLQT